jgi:hypothetical protein
MLGAPGPEFGTWESTNSIELLHPVKDLIEAWMNRAFPRMHDALIVSEQGNGRIIAVPAGSNSKWTSTLAIP